MPLASALVVQGRSQLGAVADFLGHPPDWVAVVPPTACGLFTITGYAVLPPYGHPNTSRQAVYVNGRWAKAAPISV